MHACARGCRQAGGRADPIPGRAEAPRGGEQHHHHTGSQQGGSLTGSQQTAYSEPTTSQPPTLPSRLPACLPACQVLLRHYRRIHIVYSYYSCLSPTFTFSITERLYYQFTQDARIPDDASFPLSMVEKLFVLGEAGRQGAARTVSLICLSLTCRHATTELAGWLSPVVLLPLSLCVCQ